MQESITTYLLQNKKNLKDDREVYQFLKKSFPELQTETVYDTYFPFVLSLLAHICYPCSLSALSAVLGKDIIHRQKIKRLVDRGLLKSYKLTILDRSARNAYYLSQPGTEALYSSLPFGLFEKNKLRRTGGLLPVHDYGVGLSLLQCLLREQPFSYHKEVLFASKLFKEKGTLCVDAMVNYQDSAQTCFFIEQDMGTENPSVLAGKLHYYDTYGLLLEEHKHLIISSHAMLDNNCPSFNASALENLTQVMEKQGADLVYTYYVNHKEELSLKLRTTLRAFLVRTSICDCFRESGEPKDASEIVEHNELTRNLRIKDFTLEDLRNYVSTLKAGTNQYKDMDYHKRQLIIAHRKLERMAQYIISQISNGHFYRGEVNLFLKGHSCYVLPSVLLSNYFDTIIGAKTDALLHTLSGYFPGIEKATYSRLSPEITCERFPELYLRNCYQLGADTYVCVEYTGKDLGGYVRASYLNSLLKMGLDANIHVVCVCDTPREALSMASHLNYYPKQRRLETKGIHFSFLMAHEIGTDEGIYLPTRLGGGNLLPIKSEFHETDAVSLDSSLRI
ncbi:MAG: hypothetical protein IKB01_08695 [Lachnospiraceae bacterium]|nr:hypothetical protein [Lachnospiraceae bacterium]